MNMQLLMAGVQEMSEGKRYRIIQKKCFVGKACGYQMFFHYEAMINIGPAKPYSA